MHSRLLMTRRLGLALLSQLVLGGIAYSAGLDAVAPFLTTDTLAVGRVDLRKADVAANFKLLANFAPHEFSDEKNGQQVRIKAEAVKKALVDNGVAEAFVICNAFDLRAPHNSFFVVLPVAKGKDPRQVVEAVSAIVGPPPEELPVIADALILGSPGVKERVSALRAAPRPDLAKAFAANDGATLQIVAAIPADMRRVVGETVDKLPKEAGGASGKDLADGLQWLSIGFDPLPKLSVKVTLQTKDGKMAQQVQALLTSTVQMLLSNEQAAQSFPPLRNVLPMLVPEVQGDQLVLTLNEGNGKAQKIMDELVKPALGSARTAAQLAQSTNNLKQLMLAMHNYHDTYRHFPAAYGMKKDGTKLLSWRVYLLPYVEQDALYRQFKLDEPWDSAHNKKLVERMPKVFASPALPDELVKKGMTTYVVPVGDKTVFEGSEPTPFQKITDGTSNTIAILEVTADHAAVWTKPDDLIVDWKMPLKGLVGVWKRGLNSSFCAGFCDGSVRLISDKIDPKVLQRLLQMNDGEPIGDIP